MEQLGLIFEKPKTVPFEVTDLEAFLAGKGWTTVDQITHATGWDDRKIRAVASESDSIISRPGRPGYCHIRDITRDDYERSRAAMRSQTRKMIARVIRWDREFFRRFPVSS